MGNNKDNIYLITPNKGTLLISRTKLTVLELHRKLQEFTDNIVSRNDELDITDSNVSYRCTDYIIRISNSYSLTKNSLKNISQGTILHGDKIINLGISKNKLHKDYLDQIKYYSKKI